MNILMASKIFVNSGVASHIKILSSELVARGHTVYITSSDNLHKDFCAEKGIEFFQCSFSLSPISFFIQLRKLRAFLVEKNIDMVHCHHRTCGVYMRMLSALTGVPFVWSNHLDDIPCGWIHRKTTFYGSKVICVSSHLKRFCMQQLRIPEKDIEVIIHGVTPSEYAIQDEYVADFKEKHGIRDEKIIGLFARMAPMKDHACLIDALALMRKEDLVKTKTVLFGGTEGEYVDRLKEKISQLGLEDHIIFEGYVTPGQALSLSDITVLPSVKEGFGIVSIESFLMKKPHIRTKTAGYEDIQEGCIGFDVGDSEALSKELAAFAQGKDYSKLIQKAYDLFWEKCTVERMTEHIEKVYTEACAKKGKP